MSTFDPLKHDLLGDDPPPEREPIMDRLTVPPLSEQEPCEGMCYRCGTKGLVWLVGDEWLCWRAQCNRGVA